MNILHIVIYTWEHGGPPKVVNDMSQVAIQNGHKVTIASSTPQGERSYLPIEGVKVLEFPLNWLSRFIPFYSKSLYAYLKNNHQKYDVIHLHGLWNYHIWTAYRLKLSRKIVLTPHGMLDPFTLKYGIYKKKLFSKLFQKDFLRNIPFIHALNKDEVNFIQKYLDNNNNVFVFPNGIDLPSSPNFNRSNYHILYLSRLHKKKGLDILLPAFKLVNHLLPDSKLLLAGSDYGYLPEIEAYITKESLSPHIQILGNVHGSKKEQLLSESAVFCLPTYSEGLSIAVLEALSFGLPCVVSKNTGLSDEIQTADAGIVIEDLESTVLAEALVQALKQREGSKQRAENGFRLVKEKFQKKEIYTKMYLEIKQQLYKAV